ncbi:MAG: enoyl-CoA hydratase-related protein [Saprospiraceae bacterium]|nr:enoyl-CoA hydratase-related protein [Saprospiraceae bacterium]
MDTTIILVQEEDGIVNLTINRPKALNAINSAVMSGLNDWFSEGYKSVNGLKGVIITGSGEKAFVAGADIKGFSTLTAEEGSQLSKFGQDTYFKIENFHVPVIAAVNGYALGGGCELAMACHLRVAAENALFGQPEVNLGLIPGYGGTQRLPQLIGKAKAMELTLTGDTIGAVEALQLGLVNHIVPLESLLEKCISILKKTSRKGPISISKAIRAINASYDPSVNGYEVEYKTFGELLDSDECREGVAAFIEKRKPNF